MPDRFCSIIRRRRGRLAAAPAWLCSSFPEVATFQAGVLTLGLDDRVPDADAPWPRLRRRAAGVDGLLVLATVAWPVAIVRSGVTCPMLDLVSFDGASPGKKPPKPSHPRRMGRDLLRGARSSPSLPSGSTISFDLAQVATVVGSNCVLDAVVDLLCRHASGIPCLPGYVAAGAVAAGCWTTGSPPGGASSPSGPRSAAGRVFTRSFLKPAWRDGPAPPGLAFSALSDPWRLISSSRCMRKPPARTMVWAVLDGLLGAVPRHVALVQLFHGGPVPAKRWKLAAVAWIGVAFVPPGR